MGQSDRARRPAVSRSPHRSRSKPARDDRCRSRTRAARARRARRRSRATSTCGSRTRAARSSRAPIRCASSQSAPLRHYWGDLHGQSGETVGTNPAESYFRYARDKAFVDIVGHQGNDFQITDAFWHELNRLDRRVRRAGPLRLRAGLRVVRQHRHGRRPQHLLPPRGPADPPLVAHPGRADRTRPTRLLHRARPVRARSRARTRW